MRADTLETPDDEEAANIRRRRTAALIEAAEKSQPVPLLIRTHNRREIKTMPPVLDVAANERRSAVAAMTRLQITSI
jgi:hypothetical protein